MTRILLIVLAALSALGAQAALTFSGIRQEPYKIAPSAQSGLNEVYVLYSFNGAKASYQATSDRTVTWYRYSNLGGGYAEPVAVSRNGRTTTLDLTGTDDMGYIIEEGTTRYYYWIVNYQKHFLRLDDLVAAPDQDCDMTALVLSGNADRMVYYSINGMGVEISREMKLTYHTLEFDGESHAFNYVETSAEVPFVSGTIRVHAPLCDTDFTLTGDCFLSKWGQEQTITSPTFNTKSVAVSTWATQTEREIPNEKREEGATGMGGSGPVEIAFGAAVTDAAIFHEWQMARDPEFDDIFNRYNELEFTYTFTDQGTTYVRLKAADASGECEAYGDTYEVFVGESRLECPNAFSPGASEGINDEWRVSYKSIIEFECHIFNRWGVKMATLTHPSQGWDGRYKGKVVPAGVYYYVIKAKGTDGRHYKLGGDINVIKYKGAFGGADDNSEGVITPDE